MAQPPQPPPPPGYPPHGHPPQYAARPAKPRPRKRWFAVGALLLLAAVAVFAVGLWTTIASSTRTAAVVDATGSRVDVGVEPGRTQMLFAREGEPTPSCTLADAAGGELPLRPSRLDTTVTVDGRTWVGVGLFTSPTSEVSVACDADPGTLVRIGEPLGAGFVAGLLLTIFGPLLLGGAGLVLLVVTTVLWFTRPPRA